MVRRRGTGDTDLEYRDFLDDQINIEFLVYPISGKFKKYPWICRLISDSATTIKYSTI